MWDVVRFAEHHRYKAVIVENVVNAMEWVLYGPWLAAMQSLGYRFREVYLNSMHAGMGDVAGAPQSRDRMYIVFWQKGITAPVLDIRPPTHHTAVPHGEQRSRSLRRLDGCSLSLRAQQNSHCVATRELTATAGFPSTW